MSFEVHDSESFLHTFVVNIPTGIVIVGEDTVGHFDLGIFVASIVPNGPADRDGRIRPGGDSHGH